MLSASFAKQVKNDFGLIVGFVAAVSQLSVLGKLLSNETSSITIYAACAALGLVMMGMGVWYFKRARQRSITSRKRRLYTAMTVAYAVLTILAIVPVVYRVMYLYSPDSTGPARRYRETGQLFSLPVVHAQTDTAKTLTVDMRLNPDSTSMQCVATRPNINRAPEFAYRVIQCAAFAISGQRAGQIMGMVDPRRSRGPQDLILQALRDVANARGKNEPLLERGAALLQDFSKEEWKSRLYPLLPATADEWKALKKYPEREAALRQFVIEWVGFIDPIFRVIFTNGTDDPIVVTTLQYTATKFPPKLANIVGAYQTPRYKLILEPGTHEEDLTPEAVIVPKHDTREIELLLEPKNPQPGVGYNIDLRFISSDGRYRAEVPLFHVTFFKG